MWRCNERKSEKGRKLEGKEVELFRRAALCLDDFVLDAGRTLGGDGYPTGVRIFDRMSSKQQHYALTFVLEALLGDGPPPALEAWNEAAIYAVFEFVKTNVELEADDPVLQKDDGPFWRRLVHDVWMSQYHDAEGCALALAEDEDDEISEACAPGEGCRQGPESDNLEAWDDKIEQVADLILWDRDFESKSILRALDTRAAPGMCDLMDIEPGYNLRMPKFDKAALRELDEFNAALRGAAREKAGR